LQETKEMGLAIIKIREKGIAVVLVEHDMNLVMRISDRIMVLNYGEKIAEGDAQTIRRHPKVIDAYLGKEA
jgi:branched-chain amino acid transport system ATP-binding protein